MQGCLEEKLKHWLEEKELAISPVQAAAAVYACMSEFREEQFKSPQNDKEKILELFEHLARSFYCLESYSRHGAPFSPKATRKMGSSIGNLSIDELLALQAYGASSYRKYDCEKIIDAEAYAKKMFAFDKKNIDAFAARAKRLSPNSPYSLNSFARILEGVFKSDNYPRDIEEVPLDFSHQIQGALNAIGHPSSIDQNRWILSPEEGPKSSYEMYLCCHAYMKSRDDLGTGLANKYDGYIYLGVQIFAGMIYSQLEDLPVAALTNAVNADFEAFHNIGKTHYLSESRLVGLMRFYLAHNKEKLTASDHAILEARVNRIFENVLLDQIESTRIKALYEDHPELFQQSLDLSRNFFSSYSTPDVDTIVDTFETNAATLFSRKKARKLLDEFYRARDSKPDQMDEVVLLYYQEQEAFRRLRQSIFKAVKLRNGEDGPKKAFIKSVAFNERERLIGIGLSEEAVNEMLFLGKIPLNEQQQQYPLTVEHIHDRDYGGTNHDHNFILMPKRINLQKDALKKIQLSAAQSPDQGVWILSWVPRPDSNGRFPNVLDVKL